MLQSIEIKPLVEVMNVDLESPNSVNFEPHILAKLWSYYECHLYLFVEIPVRHGI